MKERRRRTGKKVFSVQKLLGFTQAQLQDTKEFDAAFLAFVVVSFGFSSLSLNESKTMREKKIVCVCVDLGCKNSR